jgi:branched-chain amino acid transport system permease protein
VQQIINGLTLGGTYALVAVGFTIIFGVVKVLNFAHADTVLIAAFAGVLIGPMVGGNLLVMVVVGVGAAIVVGLAVYWIAIRPVRGSFLGTFLSTLAASILLQQGMVQLFGIQVLSVLGAGLEGSFRLGPLVVSKNSLLIIVVALALLGAVQLIIARTTFGRQMRAAAENPEMASALGLNVVSIQLRSIILASAVAGVAGVLLAVSQGAIQPGMAVQLGITGLIVIIVGGLGSVPGAVLTGFLLGFAEVAAVAAGLSSYRSVIAFALLIVVLLVRPGGIFGRAETVRP